MYTQAPLTRVPVPVYDGRNLQDPDFNQILPNLADVLPKYPPQEIPPNSFAMVGYTITIFAARATGNWTAGFNIKWVIVLGSP